MKKKKKKKVNRQINEQVTELISGFSCTGLDTQTLVLHHRVAQRRGFYDLELKAFCYIDDKLRRREGKGLGRGQRDNQQRGKNRPPASHCLFSKGLSFDSLLFTL